MNFKENLRRSKEVLAAYLRQGAHELGAALFGPGTAAQHPEYGMIATKTPGEIAEGMRASPPARDDASPGLGRHLRPQPEPTGPDMSEVRADHALERN